MIKSACIQQNVKYLEAGDGDRTYNVKQFGFGGGFKPTQIIPCLGYLLFVGTFEYDAETCIANGILTPK